MTRRCSVLFTLGWALIAGPPPDETMARISANVERFAAGLPDFVCYEKITSKTVDARDATVIRQTVVESTFTGRQKRAAISRVSFEEQRDVRTVNGAPAAAMPKGVFRAGGGYSSSLVTIFGSDASAKYSYSTEANPPAGQIAIGFVSKGRGQKIKDKRGTHSFEETGRAFFEAESLEIVRLERVIVTGPNAVDELRLTIDYQAVRVGEKDYRMPVRISASAERKVAGRTERGEYVAEYSGYRKFGSSSTIEYSPNGSQPR